MENPDDTAFHEELLSGALKTFPLESFLLMRRSGLSVEECLEALGYQIVDLSFQQRAALSIDPNDRTALKALLGHSG